MTSTALRFKVIRDAWTAKGRKSRTTTGDAETGGWGASDEGSPAKRAGWGTKAEAISALSLITETSDPMCPRKISSPIRSTGTTHGALEKKIFVYLSLLQAHSRCVPF